MKIFNLPDLAEGLPDAEIVNWLVKEGDAVTQDQAMVEMETAKAMVEVPSPHTGTIAKLHGQAGDVILTGSPLVSFILENEQTTAPVVEAEADSGTVVGAVEIGSGIMTDTLSVQEGVKAKPAVCALARKLKVALHLVQGSGYEGTITLADVKAAVSEKAGKAGQGAQVKAGPATRSLARKLEVSLAAVTPSGTQGRITPEDVRSAASETTSAASGTGALAAPAVRVLAQQLGISLAEVKGSGHVGNIISADVRQAAKAKASQALPQAQAHSLDGQAEKIRGIRRAMARAMAASHAQVVHTTLFDDADTTDWPKHTDITIRIIRALITACASEPALNAWFDGEKMERVLHPMVNLGLAVDTPEGLFVPVIKQADRKSANGLRKEIKEIRASIKQRKITPETLQGATITLSNFGMIAGRYATPIISLPQVAILATGGFKQHLRLSQKGIEQRRILPLSISFDHRAVTGGEAARFLAAIITDLALAE